MFCTVLNLIRCPVLLIQPRLWLLRVALKNKAICSSHRAVVTRVAMERRIKQPTSRDKGEEMKFFLDLLVGSFVPRFRLFCRYVCLSVPLCGVQLNWFFGRASCLNGFLIVLRSTNLFLFFLCWAGNAWVQKYQHPSALCGVTQQLRVQSQTPCIFSLARLR